MHFTPHHLEVFSNLSSDRNPLHVDGQYASRTQFGQIVVFGMASVLYGLGEWAKGRRFALQSIRGEFGKPLFLNDELDFQFETTANEVIANWYRNGVSQSRFTFIFCDLEPDRSGGEPSLTSAFETFCNSSAYVAEAQDPAQESFSQESVCYAPNPAAIARFEELFGLRPAQMPVEQFNCLLWTSYQVGMVFPGKQALYSSFDIRFRSGLPGPFLVENVKGSLNSRLGMVSLKADGPGFERIAIRCFKRPPPVDYPIGRVRESVGQSNRLQGRTALVTGASRGLGSALAKALALHGATILINYRSNALEAVNVQNEIRSTGQRAELIAGDLSTAAGCRVLLNRIGPPVDVLVNNASPLIWARQFTEQSADEFMDFIHKSVGLYFHPLKLLLPTLPAGTIIVSISSLYVSEAPGLFSHYVTAKSAVEGMLAVVAKEHRDKRFVTIRLPRILTDQTNTSFAVSRPLDVHDVLGRIIETICDPAVAGVVEIGSGLRSAPSS